MIIGHVCSVMTSRVIGQGCTTTSHQTILPGVRYVSSRMKRFHQLVCTVQKGKKRRSGDKYCSPTTNTSKTHWKPDMFILTRIQVFVKGGHFSKFSSRVAKKSISTSLTYCCGQVYVRMACSFLWTYQEAIHICTTVHWFDAMLKVISPSLIKKIKTAKTFGTVDSFPLIRIIQSRGFLVLSPPEKKKITHWIKERCYNMIEWFTRVVFDLNYF